MEVKMAQAEHFEIGALQEVRLGSHFGADSQAPKAKVPRSPKGPEVLEVFVRTFFRDRTLFAACQVGLVNNLND